MDLRFQAAAVLCLSLSLGCQSEKSRLPVDASAATAGSVASAPATIPSKPDPAEVLDGGADSPVNRDEGSARPPGKVEQEKVLEKPTFTMPLPGQMVSIGGGTLLVGSAPDDILRVQFAENDLVPVQMEDFEIDVLPYPGDPERPFLTGVTRAEAEQICAETGKRLCTELEWEWACKSADNRRYPTGNKYQPEAYDAERPYEPSSPFGVFAMGRILEWTSSAWGQEADQIERGVARGFAPEIEVTEAQGRRCAHRWRRMPDGTNSSLGFRCCRGEVNKASCFIEPTRPPFSLHRNTKQEDFAAIIKSVPELAVIHDNPHMFSDGDVRAVMARRNTSREELAEQGIHFVWKPMRWIPRQGMELWVAVGRSNRHSFVVAFHEVRNDKVYSHASSLILWDQPLPLALGYWEGHRDELYWAPCWGCRDGGSVWFNDATNQVEITHRW